MWNIDFVILAIDIDYTLVHYGHMLGESWSIIVYFILLLHVFVFVSSLNYWLLSYKTKRISCGTGRLRHIIYGVFYLI